MTKKNALILIMGLVALGVVIFFLYPSMRSEGGTCRLCSEKIHAGMGYTIMLADGGEVKTCCPACGLRFQVRNPSKVAAASVIDFASGKAIEATSAYYVEGSDVTHCSPDAVMRDDLGGTFVIDWHRCNPGLIAFASRAAAAAFQARHGGRILSFVEAMDAIKAS